MSRARSLRLVLVAAVVGAGLVAAAPPAGAAGTLTPWSTTVAQGASFSVTASGCPTIEEETDTGFTYQRAELILVTGSGAGERFAGFGERVDGTRYRITVPGWVDPAQPAVVTGRCMRTTYVYGDDQDTTTPVFTYPDAAVDIVAGTPEPSGPFATLDRSTAAAGQVVRVAITGCEGSSFAEVAVLAGGDLSGRSGLEVVTAEFTDETAAGGSFDVDLELNGRRVVDGEIVSGPLPEGDYAVVSLCAADSDEEALWFGEPQPLTITGTNPTDAIAVQLEDDQLTVEGAGCTGGRTATVTYEGWAYEEEFIVARAAATPDGDLGAVAGSGASGTRALQIDPDGEITGSTEVTPAPDGSWSVVEDLPAAAFGIEVSARCGDPRTDGFAYVRQFVEHSTYAEVWADRISPTSSPAGGPVTIHVQGWCEGELGAAIFDEARNVLDATGPLVADELGQAAGTVTAPDEPGTYFLGATCDDGLGGIEPYQVFAPATVGATEPLAPIPADGWPSVGPRQVYEGRIGPIDLPAMPIEPDMEMGASAGRALPPSALFIDVPRPDGDFAITKMTFDLVDADGMPVGPDQAHLHHFVITNRSEKNPACPNGTFGLPGAIVGASGAERTVLQTGDPYGIVVEDSDEWTGVYDIMSRAMEGQEVYLAYDITYRRDVGNVRPVTTYFGSASGCSSFTWTLDGSGTPDTQSHYVTIAKDARMLGAGAHLHNGASHAEWVNDRGRVLCRSEITYGDEHVGHDMGASPTTRSRAMADEPATTTTVVGEPIDPEPMYPPEFYDDDLQIESISNCPLEEQVQAGERLRFDAVYENDRARSGVMGIYTAYVWEGSGPAGPGDVPITPPADPAAPVSGTPAYTG